MNDVLIIDVLDRRELEGGRMSPKTIVTFHEENVPEASWPFAVLHLVI